MPVRATRYPGMIHGFAQLGGVLDATNRLLDEAGTTLRAALGATVRTTPVGGPP